MENETIVTESCELPKKYVLALIEHLGLVTNQLLERIRIPAPQGNQRDEAVQWWGALSDETKVVMRDVLEGIASPALITDIVMLNDDRSALPTRAVISGMTLNDPVYLMGNSRDGESYRFSIVTGVDVMVNTLLLPLCSDGPSVQAEMKIVLPQKDFAVFCALTDLSRRMYYAYMNSHDPVPDEMEIADIGKIIEDAFIAKDMRWLLPVILSFQNISKEEISGDSLKSSLSSLKSQNLVTTGSSKDTWKFTETGHEISRSLSRRIYQITLLSVGVTEQGTPGVQSGLFLKSPPLTWFIEPGFGEKSSGVITAITLEQAETLLYELFKPVTLPNPIPANNLQERVPEPPASPATPAQPAVSSSEPDSRATCSSCSAEISSEMKFCSACGAPAPSPPDVPSQSEKPQLECPSCGAPLSPGMKFCKKCGVRISPSPESIPAPSGPQCPSCGAEIKSGARFCKLCGKKLE